MALLNKIVTVKQNPALNIVQSDVSISNGRPNQRTFSFSLAKPNTTDMYQVCAHKLTSDLGFLQTDDVCVQRVKNILQTPFIRPDAVDVPCQDLHGRNTSNRSQEILEDDSSRDATRLSNFKNITFCR